MIVSLAQMGSADIPDYRALRISFPWSWTGFVLGGTTLVTALIALIEGGLSRRGLIIALVASLVIAMFYTVPFEHLLLPPNGDV